MTRRIVSSDFRRTRLLFALIPAAIVADSTLIFAEPIPLPQVDYVAATRNEGQPEPVTVRHHNGVLRLDLKAGEKIFPILIDFAKQTATVLVESENLAGEAPPGAFPIPKPGVDVGAMRLTGDTQAGEECTIWKFVEQKSQLETEVCITKDGIWMRQGRPGEKPPRYEVISLERVAQNPGLFEIPPTFQIVPFNQLPLK